MILRSLESAANGMLSLIEMNDNTAQNLANVNTVGYKKSSLTFQDIYDSAVIQKKGTILQGNARDLGTLSMGSQSMKLTYDFTQGALARTENPLDLGIEGDGFFKVQDKNGNIAYTRNGSLTLDHQSFLVTKEGDYVLDDRNEPIRLWRDDMELNARRDIVVGEQGAIEINDINIKIPMQTIAVYDFADKEGLSAVGNSKFIVTNPDENPELRAEKFTIQQGTLEMSNASVINEMINTINTSRNYESL